MHAIVNRIQLIESILEEITVFEDTIAFTRLFAVVGDSLEKVRHARHELYKQRNQRLKRFSDGQLESRHAKILQRLKDEPQRHWLDDESLEIVHEIQIRNLLKEYKS